MNLKSATDEARVSTDTPLLFISSWREGDACFLGLRGELDLDTAPALKKAIQDGIAEGRCAAIVADMSAVTFVDSTGYGVFISAMQTMRLRGKGRVHLVACQPPILRMLSVIRLDRVFTMHTSLGAVRESLASSLPPPP